MNVWIVEEVAARRLLKLGVASMVAGAALLPAKRGPVRGLGLGTLLSGLVDVALALLGRSIARRRRVATPPDAEPARAESKLLRVVFAGSVLLDLGLAGGGALLTRMPGTDSGYGMRPGIGWSLVAQGLALAALDATHFLRTPRR